MSKCIICKAEISICFNGEGSEGKFCNFLYRNTFTPRLNVISLYASYYFYLHYLHHLAQKGRSDSCKRGTESQSSVDSLYIIPVKAELH